MAGASALTLGWRSTAWRNSPAMSPLTSRLRFFVNRPGPPAEALGRLPRKSLWPWRGGFGSGGGRDLDESGVAAGDPRPGEVVAVGFCPSSQQVIGPTEVDRAAQQEELAAVAHQAELAHPAVQVASLHQAEDLLDPTAQRRQGGVHPLLPGGLTPARMATMHQPVGDPGHGEGFPAGPRIIGLVGVHRGFVATDQGVGGEAVPDVRPGQDRRADQIQALVHRKMRLVAEEAPLAPLGPLFINVLLKERS